MSDSILFARIAALPDNLKAQASNYVEFLEYKYKPEPKLKKRQLGGLKGTFKMAPDFDESMELVESRSLVKKTKKAKTK